MQKKKERSLQAHISQMFLLIIILVFFCSFVAFNVFLHNYIQSSVEVQLDSLVAESIERTNLDDKKNLHSSVPDLSKQQRSKLGTEGKVFIISSDYAVLDMMQGENSVNLLEITTQLENKQVDLVSVKNYSVKTDNNQYYLSSTPDLLRDNAYMMFYVDVTTIMDLTNKINVALTLIMIGSVILSVFISKRMAKSISNNVKSLSDFATEIGKGNFDTRDLEFKDTELNQLASSMNQSAQTLAQSEKKQHDFFQNISHELRTPLMSIRCYTEGIAYGIMDAGSSSQTILDETDRLSNLVEDLLYISKSDSKATMIKLEEHDLRETISLAVTTFKQIANQKTIHFIFDFDEQPIFFCYNENDIYQVFSNLISNAVRYAKSEVIISCHQNNDWISAAVMDDGGSLSSEDIPFVFERFYKGQGGNHGIGLSIVKSVVEQYAGNVEVKTGKETIFTIEIPKVHSTK